MRSHIMALWQQALDEGELRFPRCDDCGAWNWYPLPRCRCCQSASYRWVAVEPFGTLRTWTRVHRAFGGKVTEKLPYLVGIIDIRDAPGVKLTCLNWRDAADPRIGAPVQLELERAESGARWLFSTIAP